MYGLEFRDLVFFLLGTWVGAPVGMLVIGLCMSARRAERMIEDDGAERAGFSKSYHDALDAVGSMHLRLVKDENDETVH